MSKQPEALTLASAMTTASIVIGGLPELSGYNGAVLLIDDTERDRIVKDTDDAAAELRRLHSLNAELVDALEGTFSLSIAWAANYQAMHKLKEFHPAHAGIVNGARDVLAKAEAQQ